MSETLLPPNASSLEKVIDGAVDRDVPVPIADLWHPERCPAAFLPWLAHAMSVDEWRPDWPEETKRRIIRDTVLIHRRKGTFNSVRDAVVAFGFGNAVIVEGQDAEIYDGSFTHDGSKHYGTIGHWADYHVYLSRPISIAQAGDLAEVLDAVAPVRCRLMSLNYRRAANLYDAAITYDGTFTHGVV